MKKKILSGILAFSMLFGMASPMPMTVSAEEAGAAGGAEAKEIVLEKSTKGNPIAGFDEQNNLIYAGDPSILVDGDTVYLYVGHDDRAGGGSYYMPDYLCYSTKDMKNWTYHGVIMDMKSVSWATDDSAWAAQVIKYQGKYYLLYCAERKSGGKAVAAAVSDEPTKGFVDTGILINPDQSNSATYVLEDGKTVKEKYNQNKHSNGESFGWEDIDPTAWIESAEDSKDGKEHVYMAWGNTYPWMCELEIDGDNVKVKDQDGDGQITQGIDKDLWYQDISGIPAIASNGNQKDVVTFTEAPYLYRRQDDKGTYYGDYYLFYATHWREEMGYARTSDITSNKWVHGGVIMEPTATSDTNHPAVFDFQGHTYFIYHNGSLGAGMGQRRVICVEELFFNEDGSIKYIQETSTGLTGVSSQILDSAGNPIAHENFNNSLLDSEYSVAKKGINPKRVSVNKNADTADATWEIEPGKSDKTKESYVSIESYNKPGTYLRVVEQESGYGVTLEHDINGNNKADNTGKTEESESMTFRTLEGFAGNGVTFESVKYPGYYLTSRNGVLTVSDKPEKAECTFTVSNGQALTAPVSSVSVQKTKRTYEQGEAVSEDDIRITVNYENGTARFRRGGFTTNAASIDTSKAGNQTLTVSYKEDGKDYESSITLTVLAKQPAIEKDITPAKDLPKKNSVRTVGALKYKVTKVDEYNTDGTNGTVTVTGMASGAKYSKAASVKIPDTVKIDGYTFKVKAVAAKAFQKKGTLKTITIGSNVTSIGKDAIKGINNKATIKIPSARYNAVKKLLTSKVGYKKSMKLKKI